MDKLAGRGGSGWNGALLLLTVLIGGLASCASPHRCREDVAAARQQAATAWQRGETTALRVEGKLSLEDALRLALQHNKDLQATSREREVGRGRVLESYGQALPRLSASMGYTRLDEVSRLDIGGRSVSLGFEDNYSADITLRQPLFHGGAIPAALRTARWYALWSDETVRAAAQEVIFQTAKDYYDVRLAQELAAVNQQALRFAEMLLEDVKRKRANGLASDYDVLRAEVEVSNTHAEWIRQTNARNIAFARLLKTMGVSPESQVSLSDELEYRREERPLAEALQIAQQNRPELHRAEYAVRMQREAVRAARSAYEPRIDAFLTQKWANPDPHSSMRDEWGDAWLAGVTATVSIFDGLERRGRVAQEKARLEQAKTQLLGVEEAVALDVKQAVLSLEDAEELVASQRRNLQRAEEGLRLVQAGYREGVNTEVAVMDAQTALTRTRALFYQALYAHVTARLNLQRAIGALEPQWAPGSDPNPDRGKPHDTTKEK